MLPRVTEAVERALAAAEAEGSRSNAFLTVARERAMARAAAVPEGAPLAGLPVAVKDNICVAGLPATAGSKVLEAFVPPYTATVVESLESAGAVVVGKTN